MQLVASIDTELWDVRYDNASSEHVFTGRLVKSDSSPIDSQSVKLFLNDTQVTTLTTNSSGFIEFRRHFDPGNESDTYNVKVTYDGSGGQSATQNATALDGSSYTVCTVTYYQYKPAVNMTVVTIEPHAADVTVPVKSPEEIQREGQQKGLLRPPEAEFSWWFPWFRLHFSSEYDGTKLIDIGNALIPSADSAFINPSFANQIDMRITDLPGTLLTGMIIGETIVWAAGNADPLLFAVALGGWVILKFLLLFRYAYDSVEKLWESLIGNLISLMISTFKLIEQFLPSTLQGLAAGEKSLRNWLFAFVYKCAMIPLNLYLIVSAYDRLHELGTV
jgi:hypothetical protein